MSNAQKLFHNTLLLTITSFIMRTVSVSFNVYLTDKIGADGIGLFGLISTVYAMAVTFSSAGTRLAAMRLVAEASPDRKDDRLIMNSCLLYSLFCSCTIAIILFSFSTLIGTYWIQDIRSIKSLRILSLSLPFISMSSSLNGYFTASGKLTKYTLIQLAEQIFKIIITVCALKSLVLNELEASCNAITFGMTSAEIISLAMSYSLYRLNTEKTDKSRKLSSLTKSLLRIAMPDAVGSEMRSVLMTVEHLLIPVGLKKSGLDQKTSLSAYGTVHGMALPVVLYPSALLSSLSGLLVPEIAACYMKQDTKRISYMTARVLHIALIFSFGTAGIMFFNADNISCAVYESTSAASSIQVLSALIPIMYMDMTIDGILKGLDQQLSYMRYNIIDASLCVAFVYFLVPVFAVKGYVFVIFISEIINFALSFRRLTIVSEVKVDFFKDIFIPVLSVISAGMITCLISGSTYGCSKIFISFRIILNIMIYLIFIIIFSSIDKEELRWLRNLISGKNYIFKIHR